jgi:hypothetical protein
MLRIERTVNPDTVTTSFDEWIKHVRFQSLLFRLRRQAENETKRKIKQLKK